MELVCPAGNVDKLSYAYQYGADTAYIGLKRFSLRIKADNFYDDEYERVAALKKQFPGKRLFCALNIAFHEGDLEQLYKNIDYFHKYPIDAFIVQDLGLVRFLQREFPGVHLHLSTQASCMNAEAVKMYRDLGFRRVVLGREVTLDEIRKIKDAVPEMELECFAHGAMCIAYSGRCLMSAYLTGRSAQSGFCSQTCRWDFDVSTLPLVDKLNREGGTISAEAAKQIASSGILSVEEHQRRGEHFPVFEGDDFTAILSSKDLCMIDNLKDMKDAGVDAIKVEGRMKSVYYVAMVARAYRHALDALDGKISAAEAEPFVRSLSEVAHRESTTGFYYNRGDADKTTVGASDSPYVLAATIGEKLDAEAVIGEGERRFAAREEELSAMHPAARDAIVRDVELHPEKGIRTVARREGWNMYRLGALNKIDAGTDIELISPTVLSRTIPGTQYEFVNPETGTKLDWVNADHDCALYTPFEIEDGALIRMKDAGFVPGVIRTTGR
ncbi:MAG: U32 family peptidase [Treponema sp.]|uniref:peptidase U32 family protein n=1 Tax=Treponema sp. TaxID=166 RepID=UPI00257F6200|nr:peptidase U32 family protein [Treponema sp.]MBQ5538015.1 U32 family peptidase [Treponema sp.]